MTKQTERSYFTRTLEVQYGATAFAFIVAILLAYLKPYQVGQTFALDVSRTLLSFNGTLLALPLGFATFYLTIIETKRQNASMQLNSVPIDYSKMDAKAILRSDGQFKSDDEISDDVVRQATEQNPNYLFLAALIKTYRSMMQSFSRLLVVIAITFGGFLFLCYFLYVETATFPSTSMLPIWPYTYFYSIAVVSPFVTVFDVVLLLVVLSQNIAGKSYKDEFRR